MDPRSPRTRRYVPIERFYTASASPYMTLIGIPSEHANGPYTFPHYLGEPRTTPDHGVSDQPSRSSGGGSTALQLPAPLALRPNPSPPRMLSSATPPPLDYSTHPTHATRRERDRIQSPPVPEFQTGPRGILTRAKTPDGDISSLREALLSPNTSLLNPLDVLRESDRRDEQPMVGLINPRPDAFDVISYSCSPASAIDSGLPPDYRLASPSLRPLCSFTADDLEHSQRNIDSLMDQLAKRLDIQTVPGRERETFSLILQKALSKLDSAEAKLAYKQSQTHNIESQTYDSFLSAEDMLDVSGECQTIVNDSKTPIQALEKLIETSRVLLLKWIKHEDEL